MHSFRAAVRIVENTLFGKTPFKVVEFYENGEHGPYAKVDIGGERFKVAPDVTGNKIWVIELPIENTTLTGLSSGFAGFPTEVAGAIDRYYSEKPKGPFQKLSGIGTINLNEIIKEEVEKVFDEKSELSLEAEISSALGFIQDINSSLKKIESQKKLNNTSSEVDKLLGEAIFNLNKSIKAYFKEVPEDLKSTILSRIGEVKI